MAQSLYKIAEQCSVIVEKRTSIQVLVQSVVAAYGRIAKQVWFENTQQDEQEVDGAFLSIFTKLVPTLDADRDMYYIIIPSTYLQLPHQAGIVYLSTIKDKESWIKTDNWSKYQGLKGANFGGLTPYQPEAERIYFPTMTKENSECPLILKLAIAYDEIDPYKELNIAPNIINDIINIVTKPYMSVDNPIEKIREIIN